MSIGTLEQPAAVPSVPGEPDKWDTKWQAIGGGPNRMVFATGEPKTKYELCHRMYFMDLWCAMLRLHKSADTVCVEMGSGRGTTSQYLAACGLPVKLVDLAPEGLEIAKSNFAACGLPAPETILADIRHTGLHAHEAAVVHSVGTLEHLEPEPLADVLRESWRILAPGGLLYAVIPNGEIGGSVHRTDRSVEFYGQMTADVCAGHEEVTCEPFRLAPTVYRLMAWKAR